MSLIIVNDVAWSSEVCPESVIKKLTLQILLHFVYWTAQQRYILECLQHNIVIHICWPMSRTCTCETGEIPYEPPIITLHCDVPWSTWRLQSPASPRSVQWFVQNDIEDMCWPAVSPPNRPLVWKAFPFKNVIMKTYRSAQNWLYCMSMIYFPFCVIEYFQSIALYLVGE